MADMAQERTEEATPKRRTDARKKGTVAKSTDLTNSITFIAMFLVLPYTVSQLGMALLTSTSGSLRSIPTDVRTSTIMSYFVQTLAPGAIALIPFLITAVVVGLAANFAQVGFTLSPEAMKPNFEKINPLNGAKRLFSRVMVMEGVKATTKCFLFGFIAYITIAARWNDLVGMSMTSSTDSLAVAGDILRVIFMRVTIAWLVLAVIDYIFQKKQVNKQLMMTKEELKQEYKEMETSPELKGARMQRMRKLMKGRMVQAVQTADAIITNPTHFSVAIKYEQGKMHAPQVVAKGQDYLALRIREIAREHGVPIIPSPPLARQLYKKCEVGDFVPRELFTAVAEVLAYVYRTIGDVRKRKSA